MFPGIMQQNNIKTYIWNWQDKLQKSFLMKYSGGIFSIPDIKTIVSPANMKSICKNVIQRDVIQKMKCYVTKSENEKKCGKILYFLQGICYHLNELLFFCIVL